MDITRYPYPVSQVDQMLIFDDFTNDQSDISWVDTITDTGTALVGDNAAGIMVLTPSDGTVADNDEVYLASPNEVFLLAAGKPLLGMAYVKFTETTSGVFNCAFGFQNAVGANSIIDDGGGLKVSGSTIGIYKIDGETVWRCVSANNSVSTVSISLTTAVSTAYQKLEIEVVDFTTLQCKVMFTVNGVPLRDSTTGLPIVHTVTLASATEMMVFAGAKLGAATNNDTLSIDWIAAWQKR
jgi:hypothetical protein